ncbi:MLO-like protein 13 [Cynara cardunculus var. scolymus]|uniref:MLO-like protein 13 n=1 Tax=Cynara cardunculus var. scolymus TaxID=59895 RepID=UPI000D62E42A|nr:MLO-like protein 13 [Cynara cardunculus var. scolymus]
MAESEAGGGSRSLEYTPTWIVAVICSIIVLISLLAERGLHLLGKWLKRSHQDALYEALQKLQEELMLLGFISLLLTVSQRTISKICIPSHLANYMLPCKRKEEKETTHHLIFNFGRHLLSEEDPGTNHCTAKGKVQLVSLEGLHQLHIFVFVLAVVHVIFCATTMVLGVAKIREWEHWEHSINRLNGPAKNGHGHNYRQFFAQRTIGHYRKLPVVRWIVSFFKQFYGSVTKADYLALRTGFIQEHCRGNPNFNFHKYMLRTLEYDFKKIVGISWYLWLFVIVFLLLNISGWYTYFWLSFLPLILLLLVGAHLEHIITRLARDVAEKSGDAVKPTDDHFWCNSPKIIIYLIHFILFQNSFEIGFFFWVWTTYGFDSCVMEKVGYIVTKLVLGAIVQVLCSYSTLPLYALVSQMGSMFKRSIFNQLQLDLISDWVGERGRPDSSLAGSSHPHRLENQPRLNDETITIDQGTTTSTIELSSPVLIPEQV